MDILREGDLRGARLFAKWADIVEIEKQINLTKRARYPETEVREGMGLELDHQIEATNPDYRLGQFTVPGATETCSGDLSKQLTWGMLTVILGRDKILDALVARAMANTQGDIGLPRDKRATALRDMQAKRNALLRDEELETIRLESMGLTVLRRPDADMEIILGIWRERDEEERKKRAAPAAISRAKASQAAP